MRFVAPLLLLASCGNLQPDTPDSKINSGTNPNVVANNATANNVTSSNVSSGGDWGTDGPATSTGKSAGGNARCELSDVDTSDIGAANSADVPPDPWSGAVVADGSARCGDDQETLAWRLFNCERIGANRPPIACDQRLVWLSREHTLDMIRWDYFRHDNPAGELPQDRADRHGIGWMGVAENLVRGADVLGNHYQWMDSQGHRENILGALTHVGVGTEPLADGELLSTAVFLTPR